MNKLLYIPHFDTKTYGKVSLKYIAARLWNATFKTGSIQVNADRRKNVQKLKAIKSGQLIKLNIEIKKSKLKRNSKKGIF